MYRLIIIINCLGILYIILEIAIEGLFNIPSLYVDDAILIANIAFIILDFNKSKKTWLFIPLLSSTLLLIFSGFLNNIEPLFMALSYRSYFLHFSTYFIFAMYFKKSYLKIFMRSFLILISLFILFGFYELYIGENIINPFNRFGEINYNFRLASLSGNSLDYSYLLAIPAIYLSVEILRGKVNFNSKNFLYKGILLFLIFINIIFSATRSAIGLLIISFISNYRIIFTNKNVRKNFLLIIPFVLIFFFIFYESIFFIISRFKTIALEKDEPITRFNFLLMSLPIIRDHLFFGSGPGTWGNYIAILSESRLFSLYDITTYGISSIDIFLPHLLSELGFIGTISYYSIFIVPYLQIYKNLKKNPHISNFRNFKIGTLLLITLMINASFISMVTEYQSIMMLTASLIGISEKVVRSQK